MLVVYFMNERERWNRKEYFKDQIGRKFREWCHFISLLTPTLVSKISY